MKYVIKYTRFFYGLSKKSALISIDSTKGSDYSSVQAAAIFENKAQAEVNIKELDSMVYHLDYDESGRPEYKAVPIDALPTFLRHYL